MRTHFSMKRNLIIVFIAVSVISAVATAADLHHLWEDRCEDCHGHAGEFARHFLSVADGTLHGQHPDRDLRLFLRNHYLAGSHQVDAVYSMLLAQASSQAQFQAKCGTCHGKAAQFARESLVRRDGTLYGRHSERPLNEFLQQHRRLEVDEIAFFVKLLIRVEREVHQP